MGRLAGMALGLCVSAAGLNHPVFAHTLPDEGPAYLTEDICEESNVRIVAPNSEPDVNVDVPAGKPLIILVPGTNAEAGCAKQFRAIIKRLKDGNNILSLSYYENTLAENIGLDDFTVKNSRRYDWSTDLGVQALDRLLATSAGKADRVLVFGHSKGAHIVAQVAALQLRRGQNGHVRFWAFAQPQRTNADAAAPHNEGALGKRGYILRSSENLVTINWHNDEVWYLDEQVGVRNAWRYPGEVNEPGASGGLHMNRFDHHNNYGGHYTEPSCPYFPTGDDARYNDPDESAQNTPLCNKTTVEFHPYFWGDPQCFALAMEAQSRPDFEHYIGTSGPRGSNCRPLKAMAVDVQVRYRHRHASGNGTGFSLRFRDFNRFKAAGSAVLASIDELGKDRKSKTWVDTPWQSLMLPNSFIFQVDPQSKDARNAKNNVIDIAWVKVRFADPRNPGRTLYRYIVGPQCRGADGGFPCNDRGLTPFEGQDQFVGNLEGRKPSAWNKFPFRDVETASGKDTSNWRMKKASAFREGKLHEVLQFSGDANADTAGFYKFYSLMD